MKAANRGGGNVGDLAESGTMQLASWSLALTGEDTASSVPDASTWPAGSSTSKFGCENPPRERQRGWAWLTS